MQKLDQDNIAEFKGQIIDIFEDFCDKKGINIQNKERDNKEAGYADNENDVKIFGNDYDYIVDEIDISAENSNFFANKIHDRELKDISTILIDNFKNIISERGSIKTLTNDDISNIRTDIKDTFAKWNIYVA